MKKLFTLIAVAAMATSMWAISMPTAQVQRSKVNQPMPVQYNNIERAMKQAPADMLMSVPQEAIRPAKSYNNVRAARKAAMEDDMYAFYMRPEGILNCGIDPLGTYIFVNYPSIVGSWLNGIDAWTWRNYSQDYTKIEYQNAFGNAYPQYAKEGNTIDVDGNWVDSLPAQYRFDANSYYSYRVPLQIVSNGIEKDSFVTNSEYSTRLDTIIDEMWTISGVKLSNGLPYYFYEEDAFPEFKDIDYWPLTNASFFDIDYGFGMVDVWNADKTTKKVEYAIGSSVVTTKDKAGAEVVYQPTSVIQYFEKPMSPLYIHDVVLPINAVNYVEDNFYYTAPTFDSLMMIIMDTTMKKVLAVSIATIKDTTNMMYVPGSFVHFKIEKTDEFGGKEIGITLDEPFYVMIQGLNRPGNDFGIYCGIDLQTGGSTYVGDAKSSKFVNYIAADAFIQLNGFYYTLEDGTRAFGYDAHESNIVDVRLEYDSEDDSYIAVCNDGEMEGYLPVVASMDLLYDTITYNYNYDIIAPDWAELDMSYKSVVSDDGTTAWEIGCYFIYIMYYPEDGAEEVPAVGDEIKLQKYGKELIYRVVESPFTGLNEHTVGAKVSKYFDGKQIVIRKGNKRVNVLGTEL